MVLEQLLQDVRYATRQLTRSPLFTLVAALSLGVGITVAVTVFSLLNSMLVKPLPVSDPGSIVHVYASSRQHDYRYYGLSYADVADLPDSGVFTALTAQVSWPMIVAANTRMTAKPAVRITI